MRRFTCKQEFRSTAMTHTEEIQLGLRPLKTELHSGTVTILLVEDEKFVREVASEILRSAGYRPLSARCAEEARRLFYEHEDVHLLVTDVVLPDDNGADLAQELGSRRLGLRTIFISGYPENAVMRIGVQEHDLRYYLPKPFSSESLLTKIKQVVEDSNPISE
jgi:two-component system cell cycle sensor histidine kinase/response regulator CckA